MEVFIYLVDSNAGEVYNCKRVRWIAAAQSIYRYRKRDKEARCGTSSISMKMDEKGCDC